LSSIQFKSFTGFERNLFLSGKLRFEKCNVHIKPNLGLNYSLKVQDINDQKCLLYPTNIQELKDFYDILKYDFDSLFGTGILGYVEHDGVNKSPISSREPLSITKQAVAYLNDNESNKLSIRSFSLDEIQGLAFSIEANDSITVSIDDILVDSDCYRREISFKLAKGFRELKKKAQLIKTAEEISSCIGIYPLAYAVLAYASDHITLPIKIDSDIELLWQYMVDEFGSMPADKNRVKTSNDVIFSRLDIWKKYDETYCRKVFNELVDLGS
jgi:hypothetical protein